jgi:hypothetical protein
VGRQGGRPSPGTRAVVRRVVALTCACGSSVAARPKRPGEIRPGCLEGLCALCCLEALALSAAAAVGDRECVPYTERDRTAKEEDDEATEHPARGSCPAGRRRSRAVLPRGRRRGQEDDLRVGPPCPARAPSARTPWAATSVDECARPSVTAGSSRCQRRCEHSLDVAGHTPSGRIDQAEHHVGEPIRVSVVQPRWGSTLMPRRDVLLLMGCVPSVEETQPVACNYQMEQTEACGVGFQTFSS